MVAVRPLLAALVLIVAADGAADAAGRPRPPAVRAQATPKRQAARSKVARRLVARPPALARSSTIPSRPATLDVSGPAELKNAAEPGATEAERALQRQLDAILGSQYLKSALNGVYVVDAKSGDVLYSYAADRQLNPASNTKLISTATALDVLGPEYTYATLLYGAEPDDEGVVHGDVLLQGSGDPTLRAANLAEMAAALGERGVRKIEGNVLVSSDDRDALALPYVRVTVTGGSADGDLARVRLHPDSGFFAIDNRATTGAARKRGRVQVGTISLAGNGAQLRIAVSGRIRRGQELSFIRGVPKPVLFTGHTMKATLLNAGIEVTGTVKQSVERPEPGADMVELARHDSVPLSRLAAMINKPSNNFLADKLIMTVGAEKYGGDRSMQKGVKAMSEWLERIGIDSGSYRLENGSGLSHMIHVSARQIATVLLAGSKDERIGKDWLDSLAIGGVDGTLRARFAGHPAAGYVRGKTGTLAGVAALSGFVTLSDDQSVCFSVLTSGFRGRSKQQIRASQALIADAIFDYLRSRAGDDIAPAPALQEAGAPAQGSGEEEEGDSEDAPAPDDVMGNPDVEL